MIQDNKVKKKKWGRKYWLSSSEHGSPKFTGLWSYTWVTDFYTSHGTEHGILWTFHTDVSWGPEKKNMAAHLCFLVTSGRLTVCTTQRGTKGLHTKNDPDKERGYQYQTQTWRHVFWHSPTLTSQSSCYHPQEEKRWQDQQESFCTRHELQQKKTRTPGNARFTYLQPSFARTWLWLPITVPSKINISIYEFFLTLTTWNLKT